MTTPWDLQEFDVLFITDVTLSHVGVFRMGFEDQVPRLLEFAIWRCYNDPRRIVLFIKLDGLISIELLEALNPTEVHGQPELSHRVQVDTTLLFRQLQVVQSISPLTRDCIFHDALINLRLDPLHRCPPIALNENKKSGLFIP